MTAFTIPDETDATLRDYLNTYGYLVERDVRWLNGIVSRDLIKPCCTSGKSPMTEHSHPQPVGTKAGQGYG